VKAMSSKNATLDQLIRRARTERDLSLRQAGALVGVSGECWRQWELGIVPKAKHLAKISDSLGISLSDLFFVIDS